MIKMIFIEVFLSDTLYPEEGNSRMKAKDNFKKGSLEMLILKLLSVQDCYGYQLTQILKQESNGLIQIPSGSLYPTLYKLLDNGYITEYTVKSGKRQERIYYHLEESGVDYLKEQIDAYRSISHAILKILDYEGGKKEDDKK